VVLKRREKEGKILNLTKTLTPPKKENIELF